MTIKPNKESMSKAHYGLLKFMQDFAISIKLTAKLLKCQQSCVHQYRLGNVKFNTNTLSELKTNYVDFMEKKLKSVKVNKKSNAPNLDLIKFMHDFEIKSKFAAILLDCSENAIHRYRGGTRLITDEKLIKLKTNYVEMMEKKLKSIK